MTTPSDKDDEYRALPTQPLDQQIAWIRSMRDEHVAEIKERGDILGDGTSMIVSILRSLQRLQEMHKITAAAVPELQQRTYGEDVPYISDEAILSWVPNHLRDAIEKRLHGDAVSTTGRLPPELLDERFTGKYIEDFVDRWAEWKAARDQAAFTEDDIQRLLDFAVDLNTGLTGEDFNEFVARVLESAASASGASSDAQDSSRISGANQHNSTYTRTKA